MNRTGAPRKLQERKIFCKKEFSRYVTEENRLCFWAIDKNLGDKMIYPGIWNILLEQRALVT